MNDWCMALSVSKWIVVALTADVEFGQELKQRDCSGKPDPRAMEPINTSPGAADIQW